MQQSSTDFISLASNKIEFNSQSNYRRLLGRSFRYPDSKGYFVNQ
jgi:hypothetical protein